ncbi:MAG: hypothetical protein E7774_09785 [Bradyrhizobium sp.]|nr:MAG: hypothetical protein E7774_09785 [Bradyrhizobium sp.]
MYSYPSASSLWRRPKLRIAIVGGGATGVIAAAHLAARPHSRGDDILVIDPGAELGRGLAYSTTDPLHLLNVRAANMSALADEPHHFCAWLEARFGATQASPFSFVSRWTYGDYLVDIARGLEAAGRIAHLRERCVDLIETDKGVALCFASGAAIVADVAVLATGHDGKPALDGVPAEQPWTDEAMAGFDPMAPILIVGSGLTMVDMALSLDRHGHRGPIHVLSRRGLLPAAHRPTIARTLEPEEVPLGVELSGMVLRLRALAAAETRAGGDWRVTIDALRPYTQQLWRAMTHEQRRRFLRHARPYWDVHRHRMAPEVERRLAELIQSRRLNVIAGSLTHAATEGNGVAVELRLRSAKGARTLHVARVIDCTGLMDNPAKFANRLIGGLLARGLACVDALSIGLEVSEDLALVDACGRASKRVRALGPLARAAFWESTAIPDIRLQCRELADSLPRADAATEESNATTFESGGQRRRMMSSRQ